MESYDVVENDTRFTYRIYQLTLIKMYQHDDLIDLAAHLAEVVRSVALVNFPLAYRRELYLSWKRQSLWRIIEMISLQGIMAQYQRV